MMLVSTKGEGSTSELSLCVSAAKLITTSFSATSRSRVTASVIFPSTNRISCATADRLFKLPAYVSASNTVMSWCGKRLAV